MPTIDKAEKDVQKVDRAFLNAQQAVLKDQGYSASDVTIVSVVQCNRFMKDGLDSGNLSNLELCQITSLRPPQGQASADETSSLSVSTGATTEGINSIQVTPVDFKKRAFVNSYQVYTALLRFLRSIELLRAGCAAPAGFSTGPGTCKLFASPYHIRALLDLMMAGCLQHPPPPRWRRAAPICTWHLPQAPTTWTRMLCELLQ
mmetsp:Transcript_20712/g.40264  ORF Transcript_20712/g.40264 Transcript_20712/m.40264 type:complete len:203 (-) Transcript_20712:519-1127(-)